MSQKAPNTPKQQNQKQGGGPSTPGQKKPAQSPAAEKQNKAPNTPKQQGGDNKQNKPNTPKQQGGDNKPQQQQKPKADNKPQQPKGENKPAAAEPKQQNKQQGQQNKKQDQKPAQAPKQEQNGSKKVKPTQNEKTIITAAQANDLALDLPTSSFWAIEVEPKKAFTQTLTFPVKIKQAVIGQKGDEKEPSILYAVVDSKKWPIAVLSNTIPQQTLNIAFDAETSLTFLSSGSASIFVYGNYYPNDDYEDDSDDEHEHGFDFGSDDDDSDEDEEEEDDDSDDVSEQIAQAALKRKANAVNDSKNAQKKPKQNEIQEAPKPKAKEEPKKNEELSDGFQTLKNGLKYQDAVVGKGPKPTPGKRVTVSYVGRLTNGKVFDRSETFAFRVGVGEVIKGWDIGVASMQVGTKRRLIVPPELGYGKAGAPPDIPRNATLIFDVVLKKV